MKCITAIEPVKYLQELLLKAEAGEIVGIMYVAMYRDGRPDQDKTGALQRAG